jgi:dTDP-4-amino-4,6-dideoxygalactose transaminase
MGRMTVAVETAVPFAPPSIGAGEIAEVLATLESGWLSTGPRVRRFEQAFAAYTGAPHAVGLSSCTAALHLSLVASDIGPGDEVITTPLTFVSTANVIVHTGATPVFADIDPTTGTIDPDAVVDAITPRTRGIIPVHYGGRPVDVDAINAVARRRALVVVEDAAHCIEGAAGGRKIGTTADFTCFSFYATKNLTTGEGGMVTTASPDAAERIRIASLHGMTKNGWSRYERGRAVDYDVLMAGFKCNMTDLEAAIGLHQLASIDVRLRRREAIARRYDEGLADLPIDTFVPVPAGVVHAHHLYTILVDGRAGRSRDDVADALAAAGVASSIHFPPVHLHRYYAERYGFRQGQFPHTERIARSILSLPLSPALTDEQVDTVIRAVRGAFGA